MRTEIDPRPDPPPSLSLSSRGTFPDADAVDVKVPGVKISCMAQPLAFIVTKDREAYFKDRPERESKRVCGLGYDLLVFCALLFAVHVR